MEYQQVLPAVFIERPNRFVALCMLEGHPVTAHVKNTGRCRELLTPGAAVFLQHQPAPGRKTQYTLTHVQKGKRLVHIDSQAPNRLVEEALREPSVTARDGAAAGDTPRDLLRGIPL